MIDSHCHLDTDAFDVDRHAVLARAAAKGITDIIIPAVDEASWDRILRLREAVAPKCHAALGLHPLFIPNIDPADDDRTLSVLAGLAKAERIVAIGECGLDTTVDLTKAPVERQARLLDAQLDLAIALDLPVILHARGPRCYELLVDHLESRPLPTRGGVIHSYGGGVDFVKRYVKLPLMFGFAGPATYASNRKIRTSLGAIPDDRLLAETDAPDQCPEPYRPGRSEPAYVPEIIAGIAAARMRTIAETVETTTANARRLFGLT